MFRSGHTDSFARDRLPPADQWPDLLVGSEPFRYPERLNCVSRLLDDWLDRGWGERPCLISPEGAWTYAETAERVNRIANVLVRDLGIEPGNRVLLRSANTRMMVASYLAVMKAGAIAVATMPLLRAKELAPVVEKAEIGLALCDARLLDELDDARGLAPRLHAIASFGNEDAELERLMRRASPEFAAHDTAQDDVCLFGFTSGTTGGPKATMHFHRDVLAIADGYGRQVLQPAPDDRFVCSAPLAFTFGLGGLVVFPLAVGASAVLLEKAGPADLLDAIARFKATILFTAPTAYRGMIDRLAGADIGSLRRCVSAGEHLPAAVFEAWRDATGLPLMNGIGATELLHIFVGAAPDDIRSGATGRPVPGYEARVVGPDGEDVPAGSPGLLAVRGPTGCRYLDDPRQTDYVRDGWNYTGDVFIRDEDGYFWYMARADDLIVSAGYNISGLEVEQALLSHPDVVECAVVGSPDAERGMVVTAVVVARPDTAADEMLVATLQAHVKAMIAPYKYPRRILFRESLPKTPSGKVQRSVLKAECAGSADPGS
ncbi:MAG TPA: AMP-binding protein [Stellaceae bacterium]|nr:AMP-binding protein [Stellaceae bacterium]